MKKINDKQLSYPPITRPWNLEMQTSYDQFEKKLFQSFLDLSLEDFEKRFIILKKSSQMRNLGGSLFFHSYHSHVLCVEAPMTRSEILTKCYEQLGIIQDFIEPMMPQKLGYSIFILEYEWNSTYLVFIQSNLADKNLPLKLDNCFKTKFFEVFPMTQCVVE
jgi:hypothetical protein